MRAEYFRLSQKGLRDAELLHELRGSYEAMVNRTDPLMRHRRDKIAQKWECPKVRELFVVTLATIVLYVAVPVSIVR